MLKYLCAEKLLLSPWMIILKDRIYREELFIYRKLTILGKFAILLVIEKGKEAT